MLQSLKNPFALSICILFIFFTEVSLAQAPHVFIEPNINDYINSRKAKKEFDQKFKMGQMIPSTILGTSFIYNSHYGFEILLKDSTKEKTYTAIQFDTILRKTYLVIVDKKFSKSEPDDRYKRIYPDQTLKISRINYSDKSLIGTSKDSCWMFKIISGPINVYSYLSEEPGPTFNTATIIGIQMNDEPILAYNVDDLKKMVGEDKDALEDIEKKDYLGAIKRYNRNMKKLAKK
jgi:hypothetical protein